jgi:biotin transporter BioY
MTDGQAQDSGDELREEIDEVGRRTARTVDLGTRALVIAVAVFVLLVGLILPWMNGSSGLEVLIGAETGKASMVPRLFALTSVLFGVLASVLTLMTRRWVFAWVGAAGGWFASVDGLLAIWSRQSSDTDSAPGIGLIIAVVAMVVIAVQWFRTAASRG